MIAVRRGAERQTSPSRPKGSTATRPSSRNSSPTGTTARWPTFHRGKFTVNAAWLAIAAIAFNLLRAAGALPSRGYARARDATNGRNGHPNPSPERGNPDKPQGR